MMPRGGISSRLAPGQVLHSPGHLPRRPAGPNLSAAPDNVNETMRSTGRYCMAERKGGIADVQPVLSACPAPVNAMTKAPAFVQDASSNRCPFRPLSPLKWDRLRSRDRKPRADIGPRCTQRAELFKHRQLRDAGAPHVVRPGRCRQQRLACNPRLFGGAMRGCWARGRG